MNSYPAIESLERHQARIVRRMMVLSVAAHAAVFFLGLTITPLFPPMQDSTPVLVELTDASVSELQGETPAPASQAAPAARAESKEASPLAPVPPRPAGKENPAARRWLEKFDAGISKVPDAPIARKGGDAGGIPVRSWTSEGPAKPGDFAPGPGSERTAALGKHVEELEARVRRSGRPGVGTGSETEASMMYGGKGDIAGGGGIPAWLRDMIRKRVRDSLPELEAVYNEAIRRNPELRGKLIVRFRIDPSGKVQRAESVEGDLRDPAFVNSILEKIRRWDFEPTGGRAVDVLYPFVFVAPS